MPEVIISRWRETCEQEDGGMDGNGGQSQPTAEVTGFINRSVESKFKALNDLLVEDEKADLSLSFKPQIQRAPSMLYRNRNFTKHLKPKLFILGPIHHVKDESLPLEKFKLKLAARFIRDYGLEQESAYNKISMNVERFKHCYDEHVIKDYNDDEFSWLLFVDGCALLFYIICYATKDLYRLGIENLPVVHVLNDIFLLENQIPYGILGLLTEDTELGEDMSALVHALVDIYSMASYIVTGTEKISEHEPDHLLELLWMRMRRVDRHYKEIRRQFVRTREIKRLHSAAKRVIHWSPSLSVMELKAVRIHLRPSESSVLTDISFSPGIFSGTLRLPRLIIDDSTAVKLTCLIAYEMCPSITNDLIVASYICFFNSIIANVEDVRELRSAGILINFLPSDNEVFELFLEMTSNLVSNSTIYDDIRRDIHEHLELKGRTTVATWLADAAQVYFMTPWSTITVLAAAFAIKCGSNLLHYLPSKLLVSFLQTTLYLLNQFVRVQ